MENEKLQKTIENLKTQQEHLNQQANMFHILIRKIYNKEEIWKQKLEMVEKKNKILTLFAKRKKILSAT